MLPVPVSRQGACEAATCRDIRWLSTWVDFFSGFGLRGYRVWGFRAEGLGSLGLKV